MPTYIVTAPDGKEYEVDAPDGATKGQVLSYAQQNYQSAAKPLSASEIAEQNEPTQAESSRETFDKEPFHRRVLIGAGAELGSLGRGIGQLFTPTDSEAHKRLTAAADDDASYQSGIHGGAGFLGRALPYVSTLGLGLEAGALSRAPQAGRLAQTAIKTGVAAGEGAAYGGMREVRTGESRLANAGVGATAGVGGRAAAGGLSKLVSAARGQWVDPALKQANDYLVSKGVPVTLGDLGSNSSRFVENRLKSMFGSGRVETLQRQARGIEEEARGLADMFRQSRQKVAHEAGLPDASPEEMVAGGIKRQYLANKKLASEKYNEVSKAAQSAQAVDSTSTQSAIQQAAADAPEVFTGFGSANRNVLDWLNLGGKPKLGFDDLRELRKEVANAEAAAQRRIAMGNATTSTQNEALHLGRVRQSIESDLEGWATTNGGDVLSKFREANQFHRESVVPYRNQPETRPYIKPDANPDRVGGLLNANRPEAARRVMQATDPAGQAAAKELVVGRALDKATNPARDNLSVYQLISGLDTGKAGAQIFTKDEQLAINQVGGLAKLLNRAATANTDAQTGQLNMALGQFAVGGTAGGMAGSDNPVVSTLGGALAAVALPRVVNRATHSELVKRLVMAGIPDQQASGIAMKMIQEGTRKAAIAKGNEPTALEIPISGSGGRLATPEDIENDRLIVEQFRRLNQGY